MRLSATTILALVILLLLSNMVRVFAQPQTDPKGDCLNLAGTAVSCEPYIDIVSSDVSMSNGSYTGTITLAGNVPNSSATAIIWTIAIDADRNTKTNPVCAGTAGCSTAQNNLIFNGIGTDYLVLYALRSSQRLSFIYAGNGTRNPMSFPKVHGNTIQFFWNPSDIGRSTLFNFVVLFGIYSDGGGNFTQLLSFDKAPNVGYYEFQAGNVTAVPELTAAPIVAFMVLVISFSLLNYHKKLRRTKCHG